MATYTLTHEDGTSTSVQNTGSLADALRLFGLHVKADVVASQYTDKWFIERLTDDTTYILRRH